jgi:hypothetical protein
MFEVPVVGGRARGRAPPQPPNIADNVKIPPMSSSVEDIVSVAATATGSTPGEHGQEDEVRIRTVKKDEASRGSRVALEENG